MLRSGHFMSRPLTRDDLIRKALLVVEEACADGRVRQSMGLRFALAYLYAVSGRKDRGAFDRLWRGCSYVHPHGQHMTDICRAQTVTALVNAVYHAVGVYRSVDQISYQTRAEDLRRRRREDA